MYLLPLAASSGEGLALDLNAIVGGGAGATIIGIIFYVGKLLLDRAVPSRSDARASVSMLIEGLNNMVKVLQEEKAADSKRLADKQARIDLLEGDAEKDYNKIAELRAEVAELKARLSIKDRHINTLIVQLRAFGALVTGIELDDLEITIPAEQVPDTP